MATFQRGAFEYQIEIPTGGASIETERALAWQLYIEMYFRPAVCGRLNSIGEVVFQGEILIESLKSLDRFQHNIHRLLSTAQVGNSSPGDRCLAFAAAEMLEVVIRPFLEKWYGPYVYWWNQPEQANSKETDFQKQKAFPRDQSSAMFDDWIALRQFSRNFCRELASIFRMVPLFDIVPAETRREWMEECNQIWTDFGVVVEGSENGDTGEHNL